LTGVGACPIFRPTSRACSRARGHSSSTAVPWAGRRRRKRQKNHSGRSSGALAKETHEQMKALARVRLGRYRPRKAFATFAAAVVAVLAGVGGSVGLGAIAASNAGAVTLTPISDLSGNSNAISVQPPYIYAMPENAVAATAAPWTFYVNDNTTGVTPLGNPASVWAAGDVMTICVAPPHFAINHVETGNTVTFASTPLVAVAGTSPSTSGVTAPTFTTALTTCPADVADSNDVVAGIKDALTITFTNNPGPTANTQFIVIAPDRYHRGQPGAVQHRPQRAGRPDHDDG